MNSKESISFLINIGFQKIENVEEILKHPFIIDSIQIDKNKILLYPVNKEAKFIRNLTHLTKTYWRYILDISNLDKNMEIRPSNFETILKNALIAEKERKSVIYGFHNNGLIRKPTLWYAKKNTIAEELYFKIYKPRIEKDLQVFYTLKKNYKQ